jgi:hypothetical protein
VVAAQLDPGGVKEAVQRAAGVEGVHEGAVERPVEAGRGAQQIAGDPAAEADLLAEGPQVCLGPVEPDGVGHLDEPLEGQGPQLHPS